MSKSWAAWLAALSPRFEAEGSFEEPAREAEQALTGSIIAPLSEMGVLDVSGNDAAEFLHNQLSNDVKGLGPDTSRLAAYCTPKGRMLALFRVLRHGEGYRLLAPRAVIDKVLPRLRMFVLRSKVELQVTDSVAVFGLSGAAAGHSLRTTLGELPAAADRVRDYDGASLIHLPGIQPRYLLIVELDRATELWDELSAGAEPVGPEAWQLLEIREGLPQVFVGTQEAFVPQMANLDRIGGISFEKGCYPGQEIVARMHYLGNLKRRMFRLSCGGDAPAAGADVRDSNDGLVGQVVMSARVPQGSELLAVLQIDKAETGDLLCDGASLQVLSLPYTLKD